MERSAPRSSTGSSGLLSGLSLYGCSGPSHHRLPPCPLSHTVNLLGNLPLPCLDVLLMPKVQQGSIEYMGVNMDAVNMLLDFMEKRLDRVRLIIPEFWFTKVLVKELKSFALT